MAKVTLDVAKESTLQEILGKVDEGAGIWCKPAYNDSVTMGSNVAVGSFSNKEHGSVIINFRNDIYMINDNSNSISKLYGKNISWVWVCDLPFEVDIHETCFVMFNGDLHMLGGYGTNSRAHYKWNGKTWSVASELPYDFCNGRAIEYQGNLHILGGGTARYGSAYDTGRLNKHYAWDGETWKEASELPYPIWGATPFVCSGQLHVIGGGIVDEVNYNQTHYVWDGISWSKTTDLGFTAFNVSVAKMSDTQIYVFGGLDRSGGSNQSTARLFNGSTWSNITSLPEDAYNNTAMGATINANREVVVSGARVFKLSSGNYYGFQATPVNLEKGDVVEYRGEVHMFYQKNHYKWTMEGWEKVSAIPYNFVGGCAVVYRDKIHLIGSASSGVEDYHYSWSPEDGWKLNSNLPGKFAYGSAVVLNDELHIIGGTFLNDSVYNHYKLVNARWVTVAHTIDDVIGSKCAVVHDGLIYAATQKKDDEDGNISECVITVFDGVGWLTIGSVVTNVTADNYRYLVVYQNRIHLLVSVTNRIIHKVFTGLKSTIGNVVPYMDIPSSGTPGILVYNGRIYAFTRPMPNKASIYYTTYAPNNVPMLEIYIPKDHQMICDKKDFLPIIGEVEETEVGYKALTSGRYVFGRYGDVFSIS